MKKIIISLAIMLSITSVYAANASYESSKAFYQNVTSIENIDEILTFGALEVDSSSIDVDAFLSTDYASSIAQSIITLTLQGNDPRDYQGVDYVTLLEDAVQVNGAVTLEGDSTYANYQVVCVRALYIVDSTKLSIATDYLVSLQGENGLFSSSWGESVDLTGWVLEMLALVDAQKYETNIDLILTYLSTESIDEYGNYYDVDSGWGSYTSANTQACVLMGLIAYDKEGLASGDYNSGEYNPYEVLLTYQNDDGSFYYLEAGIYNQYATMQAAQAVGHYENGSILVHAKEEYQTIINTVEEVTPEVEEELQEEVVPEVEEESNIVDTSDVSVVWLYIASILGASAYIYYERKTSVK